MSASDSLPVLVPDDRPNAAAASDRRTRDLSMLWIAVAVVVLSFALQIRADQRVQLFGLSGLPAPEMCGSRVWFEIECPGCGLTRGFIHLAGGNWSTAVRQNRMTPLLALAVLVQIPYRIAVMREWGRVRRFAESAWPNAFGWVLIVALIGNWLLKLLGA